MKPTVSMYDMEFGEKYDMEFGEKCGYQYLSNYVMIDINEELEYKGIKYIYLILNMNAEIGSNYYNLTTETGTKKIPIQLAQSICNNIYDHIDKFLLVKPSASIHDPGKAYKLAISNIEDESLKNELIENIKRTIIEYLL